MRTLYTICPLFPPFCICGYGCFEVYLTFGFTATERDKSYLLHCRVTVFFFCLLFLLLLLGELVVDYAGIVLELWIPNVWCICCSGTYAFFLVRHSVNEVMTLSRIGDG